MRTDHAIALIRSTGLSFDQVADQSGFRTTSHLSRRVKEHTGVPPRELRRLERNRPVDG
ncbi:MAG: helix-turn-helix domain-containing protein [Spirochaetales bacterium]